MKIPKHPMTLLITQNTHVKNTKIPLKAKLLSVFSKVKGVILLYMESEKPEIAAQLFFFILRAKKYFYDYKNYEKSRKPLINNSKFC